MNTNGKQGKGYVGKPNTAMADKLGDIKDKVQVRTEPKQNGYNGRNSNQHPPQTKRPLMRKVIDLGQDGEDHINVYSNCKTTLGQFFCQSNISKFVHPYFGNFLSRENFYHFLLSIDGDESLRNMKPSHVRHYVMNCDNVLDYYPNLHYHMASALWIQIKNNWNIARLIRKNELPYEAYFTLRHEFNGKFNFIPVRPQTDTGWIINIILTISEAVKNNVEPNFDYLIDDQDSLTRLANRVTFVKRQDTIDRLPKKKKPKFKPEIVQNMIKVDSEEELAEHEKEVLAMKQSPLDNMAAMEHEENNTQAIDSVPATENTDTEGTSVKSDPIAEVVKEDVQTKVSEETNIVSDTEPVQSDDQDRT